MKITRVGKIKGVSRIVRNSDGMTGGMVFMKKPRIKAICPSFGYPPYDSCVPKSFNTIVSKKLNGSREAKQLESGDIVIAAITSCTNTSNPSVILAAGLVAKKAKQLGLKVKPWVKTSLAPGSQVVTDYLKKANLMDDLDALGFNLVGYGCTTCIGNSGPLADEILIVGNPSG